MNVIVPVNPVTTTQQPNVEFVLGDLGGAFVSVILIITEHSSIKARLLFDDAYAGSKRQWVDLGKGTYPCLLKIHAFKEGALNPTYDTFLHISGSLAAFAKGSIPQGEVDDDGSARFDLVVG